MEKSPELIVNPEINPEVYAKILGSKALDTSVELDIPE